MKMYVLVEIWILKFGTSCKVVTFMSRSTSPCVMIPDTCQIGVWVVSRKVMVVMAIATMGIQQQLTYYTD